jgi:hypothetical protein
MTTETDFSPRFAVRVITGIRVAMRDGVQAMRMTMDDAALLPLHYQSIILAARKVFAVEARTDEETRAMNMRPAQ